MQLTTKIFLLAVISALLAGPASSATLCMSSETVRFSCELKGSKKIVSVCSSADLTIENGYIQYRFGKPSSIELEYPSSRLHTQQHFTWLWQHPYHGFIKELSFQSGSYIYTIFSVEMGPQLDDNSDEEDKSYGVRVKKIGTPPMEYKKYLCTSPPTGNFDDFSDILPSKDHE